MSVCVYEYMSICVYEYIYVRGGQLPAVWLVFNTVRIDIIAMASHATTTSDGGHQKTVMDGKNRYDHTAGTKTLMAA